MIKSRRLIVENEEMARKAAIGIANMKSCENCHFLKYGKYHGMTVARCGIDGATHGGAFDTRIIVCDKYKAKR